MGNCITEIFIEAVRLKREGQLTPQVLSPDEQLLRETQHVVEYLQARQEWKRSDQNFAELSSIHEDLKSKYAVLVKPKPPSHWFYLWLRQLFLPIFENLKRNPFGQKLVGFQKWLKRGLIKE
jgi:hypothetical protein